jgi:hypothetical protein
MPFAKRVTATALDDIKTDTRAYLAQEQILLVLHQRIDKMQE